MNLKKELIKAGFKDQTDLTGAYGDELDFELYYDLPKGKYGTAGIRLQKLEESNEVEITIYSDSGYELLIALAEIEEDVYE